MRSATHLHSRESWLGRSEVLPFCTDTGCHVEDLLRAIVIDDWQNDPWGLPGTLYTNCIWNCLAKKYQHVSNV